jgi:hypothetical protein
MGFIPRPHQVELTLERRDLRSVNTNLMGHLTWPAASLQARLWERLARWAGNLCLRGIVDCLRDGSHLDHQRILMYKRHGGNDGHAQSQVADARELTMRCTSLDGAVKTSAADVAEFT